MNNSTSTFTNISLDLSQSSLPASSDIAQHLCRQVAIVADLLDQHQSSLIGPERDWIENAINYTKHLLDKLNWQAEKACVDSKFSQRLSSFYNLKPRKHQAHVDAASLGSQLLVAMQNLNSAMEMLTRCARLNPQSSFQAFTTPEPQEEVSVLKTELSLFLNRGRAGRHSSDFQHRKGQTTIAELRASNSLLHNNTNKMLLSNQRRVLNTGKLPLTLAETVEIWRLNAEDALRAATVRFFEQEELPKDMADNSTLVAGSVRSEAESNDQLSPVSTHASDSRQGYNTQSTTSNDVVSREPSESDVVNAISSHVPRRKPVNGTDAVSFPYRTAPAPRLSSSSTTTTPSSTQSPILPTTHSRSIPSTSSSPAQSHNTTTQPFNTTLTPYTSLNSTLSPSSTAASTSATSPYNSIQSDALVSVLSFTSTTQHAPHSPPSDTTCTDSIVSLPHPLSDVAHQDLPTWQQPESRSTSRKFEADGRMGRKSRGRAWLEKQAALCDD